MTLKELQAEVDKFIEERDWKQFHADPRSTLLALGSEVGELMDIYRFTNEKETKERMKSRKHEISDEIADLLYLICMLCDQHDIDLEEAFTTKQKIRAKKYPIQASKGKNKKYNEL
jgi:NTP pyrophosphatase (non-canonical NTP hydrolase)